MDFISLYRVLIGFYQIYVIKDLKNLNILYFILFLKTFSYLCQRQTIISNGGQPKLLKILSLVNIIVIYVTFVSRLFCRLYFYQSLLMVHESGLKLTFLNTRI